MRAVIQKVKNSNVKVDGELVGEIKEGLLVFLGVKETDTDYDLAYIKKKFPI